VRSRGPGSEHPAVRGTASCAGSDGGDFLHVRMIAAVGEVGLHEDIIALLSASDNLISHFLGTSPDSGVSSTPACLPVPRAPRGICVFDAPRREGRCAAWGSLRPRASRISVPRRRITIGPGWRRLPRSATPPRERLRSPDGHRIDSPRIQPQVRDPAELSRRTPSRLSRGSPDIVPLTAPDTPLRASTEVVVIQRLRSIEVAAVLRRSDTETSTTGSPRFSDPPRWWHRVCSLTCSSPGCHPIPAGRSCCTLEPGFVLADFEPAILDSCRPYHACTLVAGFVSSISSGTGSVFPIGFIHSLIWLGSFYRFWSLTRGASAQAIVHIMHISIPGRAAMGRRTPGVSPRRAGSLPRVVDIGTIAATRRDTE